MFRHFLLWHDALVARLYVPKGKMSGCRRITEQDEPPNHGSGSCCSEGSRSNY